MTDNRTRLPQLSGRPFLTDGGLETTLVFHRGIALPEFAAFHLLKDEEGRRLHREYFRPYLDIAVAHGCGFIFESATWRASSDWGRKIGYSENELKAANTIAIEDLAALRREYEGRIPEMPISGCLGPRGDGYTPGVLMSAREAEAYHRVQAQTLADAGAELISAMTLNYVEEAIGIVNAARAVGMPVVISFTVETDGCLPSGQTLREAIEMTDDATDGAAAYFMINCAHPTHFDRVLDRGAAWTKRLKGIRANASALSHAELNDAAELDDGDPADLGARVRGVMDRIEGLNVFGGCCGTDHRHVAEIAKACIPAK